MLELMIAIAIIGILAEISIANYLSYTNRARYAATVTELRQISQKADQYYLEHNKYPDNLQQIGYNNDKDPWGHPYQYLSVADAQNKGQLRKDRNLVPVNSDYDLYSMGADGKTFPPFTAPVSQDDIVRADNGSYYGYVKDY